LSLQAIALEKEVLGEEHSSYAASLNILASLYEGQEDFEQAKTLYLKANNIIKNTLGNQHPEYALSLIDVARIYNGSWKFKMMVEDVRPLRF